MTESRFDPEDEAFNEIERQSQQRKEAVKTAIDPKGIAPKMYDSGWNAALELAAYEIENNFRQAFGADTLSSIAIYIRGMKK